jgi:predicted ABC-type ATPase
MCSCRQSRQGRNKRSPPPKIWERIIRDGAGETTFAREFLPSYADCRNFINADLIAQGMSPFSPEAAAFHAGRLMLTEINLLAKRGADFGFETTLSGRSHLRLIRQLKSQGYAAHFFFLWLPSVDLALSRVRGRVLEGGHNVPEAVVRRRFARSIGNFFTHYRRLADSWTLFDNSGRTPDVIALEKHREVRIIDSVIYTGLVMRYDKI